MSVESVNKVYKAVKENPGKTAVELSKLSELSPRAVRYHLKTLKDEGKVVKMRNVLKDARSRVYFASENGSADAIRTHPALGSTPGRGVM